MDELWLCSRRFAPLYWSPHIPLPPRSLNRILNCSCICDASASVQKEGVLDFLDPTHLQETQDDYSTWRGEFHSTPTGWNWKVRINPGQGLTLKCYLFDVTCQCLCWGKWLRTGFVREHVWSYHSKWSIRSAWSQIWLNKISLKQVIYVLPCFRSFHFRSVIQNKYKKRLRHSYLLILISKNT